MCSNLRPNSTINQTPNKQLSKCRHCCALSVDGGGWASDHAVVDRQLNTMHLFKGVEIGAVPAARKRLLKAVVGS